MPSYLSQLEQRLGEIESTVKGLQQSQSKIQTGTVGAPQLANGSQSSIPESSIPPEPPGRYPASAEMGEIDASEDAIDGMGAIKFTDEEDCGYFGMAFLFGPELL